MKVKYVGESFGVDGLTNGQDYDCLGVEGNFLRVIDDSGEDYLYPINDPAAMSGKRGKWIIVTDSADGALRIALYKFAKSKISYAV